MELINNKVEEYAKQYSTKLDEVLQEIEDQFRTFVLKNKDNPKSEFYIPSVVNSLIEAGKVRVKVMNSDSQWYGVTYTDDKETVQGALKRMVEEGKYPKGLRW